MTESAIPDEVARREALDPARSFIVQAPAGAGKTELLTQRFLALLATVAKPEEILAITFTKKAAAEMRARVLEAMVRAASEIVPSLEHERRTWELARRARARDAELGWRIERNPGRLAIQTIDSFCLGLTRQLPLLARFGAPPSIVDQAAELYRDAAVATLALLEEGGTCAVAVERLLRHLDNDTRRVSAMLADMLARRDQWLRRVGDRDRLRREALEAALANAVGDALLDLQRVVPTELAGELVYQARAAAANLRVVGIESDIVACAELPSLPGYTAAELFPWLGVAELLLTDAGSWRKTLGKKQGYAAKADGKTAAEKSANEEAKNRALALIDKLSDYPDFGRRLHELRELPPPRYDDGQWEVLLALVEVLPLAAAQLKVVFAERGGVDFTDVSQGAAVALGAPEAPTDLLLALDYRLRHLLVDEFQDTSISQFELFERLTAGWTAGDGRTLFLVGDPMQSIYRFREAEVGLYLRAARAGIGGVALTKLTLSANFRSQAGIVEWVNRSFEKIFPRTEDVAAGAVRYSPAAAVQPPLPGAAVTIHPCFGKDAVLEAEQVLDVLGAAWRESAEYRCAILVRNRDHLAAIVPRLKRAGLRLRAIEIERLAERQAVRDLLALTRALLHPADRVAWLALLRAPWCGLSLSDLHVLAADDHDAALWDAMRDEARVSTLSADGQRRLRGLRTMLATAIDNRGRRGLRRQVEGLWTALGGPACTESDTDLTDAEVYFRLLDELDDGSMDLGRLAQETRRLFAAADADADERLQVMTIHRAKGLEFDVVIVPGLGRTPRPDAARLLQWTERARGRGEPDLLLAPIHAAGADGDAISGYLRRLETIRARQEELRLLYVAATRARKRLHLLGHVTVVAGADAAILRTPGSGSLLKALWPAVEPVYAAALDVAPKPATVHAPAAPDWTSVQQLTRLAADWQLPAPPPSIAVDLGAPATSAPESIEFSWVGTTARHVGTVVHRGLMRIGREGLDGWDAARIASQASAHRLALAGLGVAPRELEGAAERVQAALINVLEGERGRWVLAAHVEARCEYALTGLLDGRLVNVVLDRTFVDRDGLRWIVDYKTSMHEGADREAFLDRERDRYRAQLERYARLLAGLDSRPVRLGLYFPMLNGWREIEKV